MTQFSYILLCSTLLNYSFMRRTCSRTLPLVIHWHPIMHCFIQLSTRNNQIPKSCLPRLPMSVHLLRKIVSKPSWNRTLQSCTCFQNLHIYDIECNSCYFTCSSKLPLHVRYWSYITCGFGTPLRTLKNVLKAASALHCQGILCDVNVFLHDLYLHHHQTSHSGWRSFSDKYPSSRQEK